MPGGPEAGGYTPESEVENSGPVVETESTETPDTPETAPEAPAENATENTEQPGFGAKLKEAIVDRFVPTAEEKAEKQRQKQENKEAKAERKRDKKEQQELAKNAAAARERRVKGYAEIIKHGARSPEELQQAMQEMSFKDFKEAQERAEYGSSVAGKLKAFLAGERDFAVNDDGTIEGHKALTEAGRRVLSTVFNRRTAASAGMLMVMGALTGGLGWAAGGVLMGGVAGRGTAEMGELFAGKTREAREKVLYAERARWDRMQALALESRGSDDPAVQAKATQELVDIMYKQGESVWIRDLMESEKNLAEKEASFNKLRNKFQTAGELVGAAAGLTSILNGGAEHLDMDFFNKIDGQSVFHGVQQSQHGFNFLYSSGAEAGLAHTAGATILGAGQFGAHALEATTSQVLAYTVAERTLPMLLASGLAWSSERGKKYGESPEDASYRDRKAERLGAQIEKPAEYIRKVADENHNPVPNSPEGYAYSWNERPSSADAKIAEDQKIDKWYQFVKVDGVDQPRMDPATGRFVEVGVLGVDVENNRIAVARFENTANKASHIPIEVMRLDEFVKNFHLHKNAESGQSFSVGESETDGAEESKEKPKKETDGVPAKEAVKDLEEDLKQEAKDNKNDKTENEIPDSASAQLLSEFVGVVSRFNREKPDVLERAGISFHNPYAGSHEATKKGYERVYTLITTDNQGKRNVINIPMYPDGKVDLLNTKISHINPEGKDKDNIHILNPKKIDLDNYMGDIIDRIKIAGKTEATAESNTVSKEVTSETAKEPESGIEPGTTFQFSEDFRNDKTASEWRRYLGDTFFLDVDDNKRTKKLVESEYKVDEVDEEGVVTVRVRRNGNYSDEVAYIPSEYLRNISNIK